MFEILLQIVQWQETCWRSSPTWRSWSPCWIVQKRIWTRGEWWCSCRLSGSRSKNRRGCRPRKVQKFGRYWTRRTPTPGFLSHFLIQKRELRLMIFLVFFQVCLFANFNIGLKIHWFFSTLNSKTIHLAQCLKITEKVAFNIASEASYDYIKNGKYGPFWRVFENLKLAVKQCYQTCQF